MVHHTRVARLVFGIIAALLMGAAALFLTFPDNAREYWLYLSQDRPSLVLAYDEISQDWTETEIKKRFAQLRFRCYDNRPGEYLDQRSCFADIGDHNGKPAMAVAFYLSQGKVNHVGISVPWWAHGRQASQLRATFGNPYAAQRTEVEGVRLAGWRMPGGHAIFFNRDRPLNPERRFSFKYLVSR
jgi:hypothetical protein